MNISKRLPGAHTRCPGKPDRSIKRYSCLAGLCTFFVLQTGTALRPLRPPPAPSPAISTRTNPRPPELQAKLESAIQEYRSGRYIAASRLFQSGYGDAIRAGEHRLAARCLANWGGCRLALHDYAGALDVFRRSRQLAEAAADAEAAASMDANISSVYALMGDLDMSAHWIEQALARIPAGGSKYLPKIWILLGTARARQDRMAEALEAFRRAIEGADRAGDWDTYATAWDRVGEEHFRRHELDAAERAALEAFRVRKLRRLPAFDSSLRNVARIRLARGDIAGAAALLDRAVERLPRTLGLHAAWDLYYLRGRTRLAGNTPSAALEDLRTAVRLSRAWRLSAPPDDAARIAAEGRLQQLYSALIEAANRLYFETGRRTFAEESFAAAEENRAASLKALMGGASDWRTGLPETYWEEAERLGQVELQAVARPSRALDAEATAVRARLAALEDEAGTHRGLPPSAAAVRVRAALADDAVLLSFHLAEPQSYVWAVTRDGIELEPLPPRRTIAAAIEGYLAHLDVRPGSELYRILFGGLDTRVLARPKWLLSLDEDLFRAPVAALPAAAGPEYVVERHEVQIVSSAALLARPDWQARLSGPLVGVGDAVYNRADPRWGGTAAAVLELPRLPGTRRELETCGREWGPASFLTGREACKELLRDRLREPAAVVHVATHVVETGTRPRQGLIVLALEPKTGTQVLGAAEIAAWKVDAGLVTLSGCSSGAADALPGSGLMGLTRAWVAAGAGAVVATRWPTPDDSGVFFQRLYHRLRENRAAGPAAALAFAQREALHTTDNRSAPRYWGSYFVVANQ